MNIGLVEKKSKKLDRELYVFSLSIFALLITGCSTNLEKRINSTGSIIVSNKLSNTAQVFDLSSGKEVYKISTGVEPHEMAISPNDSIIVITNYKDASVTIFDLNISKPVRTLHLNQHTKPHGICFINKSQILVTSETQDCILLIDINEGRILKDIGTGQKGSHMVVYDSLRNYSYVSNMKSGSVSVIDLKTHSLVKIIKTGSGSEGLGISKDFEQLWVANRNENTLSIINLGTLLTSNKLYTAEFPVRVNMFGNYRVIITHSRSKLLRIFDGKNKEFVSEISLKQNLIEKVFKHTEIPVGTTLSENFAFVSTTNGNSIKIINLSTLEIEGSLETEYMPDGIVYSKVIFSN